MREAVAALVREVIIDTSSVELSDNEVATLNANPVEFVTQELLRIFNSFDDSIIDSSTIKSRAFSGLLSLEEFDKPAFLLGFFERATEGWCYAFIRSMSQFNDPRVVQALIQVLLYSNDADERYSAAEALGEVGDDTALDALRHAQENDIGEDYEGFPIADRAKESIGSILRRTAFATKHFPPEGDRGLLE